MKLISLWSGPRNVSTALMYSFAQRPDTIVVDEPLYAYYLEQTDAEHPGKEEILKSMSSDPSGILKEYYSINNDGKHVFLKNMAHHAIQLSDDWYEIPIPVFLIRDPWDMLPSLSVQIPGPQLRDTGLAKQVEMLNKMIDLKKDFVVIDACDLLQNLQPMLEKLCNRIGLTFFPGMLSWNAGPIAEDGVWAKYWYHKVHDSTGFQAYHKTERNDFPAELRTLLDSCLPYYELLSNYKMKL